MNKVKRDQLDQDLFDSFVHTSDSKTFRFVIGMGIDAEKLKGMAIEILDDPNSPESHRQAALLYAETYKGIVLENCQSPPENGQKERRV